MPVRVKTQTPQTIPPTIVLDDSERQPCEIWTRVMGYHRPIASFNTGKKAEFKERCYFVESHVA